MTHHHGHESGACDCLADADPEEAARRTATASGFAGSVLGAVGGPVGAGLNGLVWGTAGYVAGYTAAKAREATHAESSTEPIEIHTSEESDDGNHDDGDPDSGASAT